LLGLLAIFSVNKAIEDKFFIFAIAAGFTIGFFGGWAGIYKRCAENKIFIWLWNLLGILVIIKIFPPTADMEFVKRCLVGLAVLNVLQVFVIFKKRDLAVSQLISTVLIILAPPLMLEELGTFVVLLFLFFILWISILFFSSREDLMDFCEKRIDIDRPDQGIFKKACSVCLTSIFIAAVAIPIFFALVRFKIPILIISPYHRSEDFIDFFVDQSAGSVETPGALNKFSTAGNESQPRWLIVPGGTTRIFMHGMEFGKSKFGKDAAFKDKQEAEDIKTRKIKEDIVKERQKQAEIALYKIADTLWNAGRFFVFILFITIFGNFFVFAVNSYIEAKRMKVMALMDPKGFIKKAYLSICQVLDRYIYKRSGDMAPEEYLYFIKNKEIAIGPSFEILTDKFQEAVYSNHSLNTSDVVKLYNVYRSILQYLRHRRFSREYIAQRFKSQAKSIYSSIYKT
jgi:hypothetical protein